MEYTEHQQSLLRKLEQLQKDEGLSLSALSARLGISKGALSQLFSGSYQANPQKMPAGTTLQERRSAVLAKLRDEGRQDLAYWYGVADSLEYDVTIEEHWPFCCGIHQCADPSGLTPEEIQAHPEIGYLAVLEIRWWWNVIVHGDRLLRFRCGESLCGELLMDWRAAASLECVMLRDKLAHTLLTFTYEEGE